MGMRPRAEGSPEGGEAALDYVEYAGGYQGILNFCLNNNVILSFRNLRFEMLPGLAYIPLDSEQRMSFGLVYRADASAAVRSYVDTAMKYDSARAAARARS